MSETSINATPMEIGSLGAVLNFVSNLSLDEIAEKLSTALNIRFRDDIDGKYEEYPAALAQAAGLSFALLGAPSPEYDIREDKSADFQLVVSSELDGLNYSLPKADLSSYFAKLIESRTGLSCEPSDGRAA